MDAVRLPASPFAHVLLPMPYLEDLTVKLAVGATGIDAVTRERHGGWLLERQQADGGFAGREGGSDLYYTGFALRSLMVLGALDGAPADAASRFLRGQLAGRAAVVDLISLLMSATMLELSAGINPLSGAEAGWKTSVAELLESLRRDDGGYAKSPEGRAGSMYQTFLSVLAYQMLELPLPAPERVVAFLGAHEHADGGYLEIRVGKRPGVNPTAAAIATLRILEALSPEAAQRTIDFLSEMQADEGGLAANTRIPLADLLSTFTGLLTLTDLGAADQIDRRAALGYVLSMQRETGGFAGFAMDPAEDVEYTFYGLGCLALLARPEEPA